MSKRRSALRNHLEFSLYRGARLIARSFGPSTIAACGATLGRAFFSISQRRRDIINFNLQLALPEKSDHERLMIAHSVARHFGRIALDALRIQSLNPRQFRNEVTVEGRQHLTHALARGRGVILLSAHIGSWEVAALETGLALESGFAIINRPLDNPFLETELDRLRSLFGNRALGRNHIAKSVLRQLGNGGGVGILIDQRAPKREAIEIPFFGHPASTHPILARFARKTLAPVVPLWAFWESPAHYTVRYEKPVFADELPADELEDFPLTARFSAITEAVIRQRPDQWLWYHDRWRDIRLARTSHHLS